MLLTKLIVKGLDLETATSRVDGYLEAASGEDAINKKILEAIGHLLSTEDKRITVAQYNVENEAKTKLENEGFDEKLAEKRSVTIDNEGKEEE